MLRFPGDGGYQLCDRYNALNLKAGKMQEDIVGERGGGGGGWGEWGHKTQMQSRSST